MKKLATIVATAALGLALAACDPAPPINTNEVDQTNLEVDETPCGPEVNRVCP